MSSPVIRVENLSKLYRLGEVSTGTISHDLNRWWHRLLGKEDPYAKIGQVNDLTRKVAKPKQDGVANPAFSDSALSKEYVWALKDVNFEVRQGEVLGIIGRNGAGKSTLLKILSRVTAPTKGGIKVKGRIASLLEVGTGFHPELTGRENVYLYGAILGMRRHEITKRMDAIVDFSGCAAYLDTPVKRYSSGMYVRLAFSVAAHLSCDVLIVDEVLAVGDAGFQRTCIEKMEDCATSQGTTVLVVSHNLQVISALCNRSIVLENGCLEYEGLTNNGILFYNDRVLSSLAARNWSAEADSSPGDHRLRLLRVRCQSAAGEAIGLCPTHLPLNVEMEIRIEVESPTLRVGFCLHDSSGAIAFASYHDDGEGRLIPLGCGRHLLSCTIPSGVLNGGHYWISPRISSGIKDWIVCLDRLVSFETILTHIEPPNALYPSGSAKRPGVSAPLLVWSA